MFKKILLAFDGSVHAHRAADYVLKLAKDNNAEVEIVTVREPMPPQGSRVVYDRKEMDKQIQENAQKIVQQAEDKFQGTGITYVSKILKGDPADAICKVAEEDQITEIVMGSRGVNPISRFLLGSVSSKVLNYSPCTVVIVK
jgi:nucleotide-binding universal stress UspA family protein